MKRTERHHLKENEFAEWLLGAKSWYEANSKTIATSASRPCSRSWP